MSEDSKVVRLRQPEEIEDALTAILCTGARRLLEQAIEAEVETFLASLKDITLPDGRDRVVRHGHGPERTIQTGIGPVEVRRAKVRDRGGTEAGERIRFTSAILPRWARRTKTTRQRLGRDHQRPLQDRGVPTLRPMARPGGRRVRHPGMDGLVQPPAPARTHRQHSSRRRRSALLCSSRGRRHRGVTQAKWPPTNPERFRSDCPGNKDHLTAISPRTRPSFEPLNPVSFLPGEGHIHAAPKMRKDQFDVSPGTQWSCFRPGQPGGRR
ncbi:transposase (plasmid) [Azospirillum sp. B510]|nr:transposase [Azospirillum sp. B510]